MGIKLNNIYNLLVSSRGIRPNISIENITSNLLLDDLGDQITDNQILIKKLSPTYKKVLIQVEKDGEYLFDEYLDIFDRNVAPSSRTWIYENEDSIYKIRKGLQGIYEGKWVLDENGVVTAYTEEDTTTAPWDATWVSSYESYVGYDNILCSKVIIPIWGVLPLSDIIGDIGDIGGGTGTIEWAVV